jgi:hypothetical protein
MALKFLMHRPLEGATTLTITTSNIMSLSVMGLNATLSVSDIKLLLSVIFIVMLSVAFLIVMLSVLMLNNEALRGIRSLP